MTNESGEQTVTAIKTNPNVLYKRLGEEMVLFHLTTDRFYELNATAARFWELLADGRTLTEVTTEMMAEFAVTPEEFAYQAESLLTSLRKEDLVDIHE